MKKKFIFLPKELLKWGGESNEFVCVYEGKYWSDGTGVHSFIDVDGK